VTEPSFFKVMKKWMRGGDNTKPKEAVAIEKRSRADFRSLPVSGLRITWMGHSAALVEIDGKRLLLDPVWSERASPFGFAGPKRFFDPPLPLEDLPPIDAVLITHDHYDHLDKPTVERLHGAGARFVVPLGVGARLNGWGVAVEAVVELDWWQTTRIGEVTVTATPASHFSGRSVFRGDRDRTLWAGFAIHGPTHRVYYSGDTGMSPGFSAIGDRLGPFDAALIEVGAYDQLWADLHLGPEQAVEAFNQVRGKLLIPVHWGTFDLALHSWTEPVERLFVAAEEAAIPLAIPRIGQSVEPSAPPPVERWWPQVPWRTADEYPVVSSGGGARPAGGENRSSDR
jgi:L-ascorbate metabolism protein UlaG (beta-lactamase superfamily)